MARKMAIDGRDVALNDALAPFRRPPSVWTTNMLAPTRKYYSPTRTLSSTVTRCAAGRFPGRWVSGCHRAADVSPPGHPTRPSRARFRIQAARYLAGQARHVQQVNHTCCQHFAACFCCQTAEQSPRWLRHMAPEPWGHDSLRRPPAITCWQPAAEAAQRTSRRCGVTTAHPGGRETSQSTRYPN